MDLGLWTLLALGFPGSLRASPNGNGIYGAGFGADAKGNLQVHNSQQAQVAYRFRASTTSQVKSVRVVERGGPVYSGGTGGQMQVMIEPDEGSAAHLPSGTVLASMSFTPGNPSGSGWETYTLLSFSSPPTLTKGQLYHVVFKNIDPNQDANYISVNHIFVGNPTTPRQPFFADVDYCVLGQVGGQWQVAAGFTAPMDVTYADGAHDGQSYYGTIDGSYGLITGNSMVREQFTVSGGDRTVSKASVRVGKQSGGSALTITLETGSGTLIEKGTIPAASIISACRPATF